MSNDVHARPDTVLHPDQDRSHTVRSLLSSPDAAIEIIDFDDVHGEESWGS